MSRRDEGANALMFPNLAGLELAPTTAKAGYEKKVFAAASVADILAGVYGLWIKGGESVVAVAGTIAYIWGCGGEVGRTAMPMPMADGIAMVQSGFWWGPGSPGLALYVQAEGGEVVAFTSRDGR